MIPVSGERHERAVEAATRAIRTALPPGAYFTPATPVLTAIELAGIAIDAYFASLREQGVVLLDLREVVEFARTIVALPPALIPDVLPDAIERRFGGNERSEP